MTDDTGTYTIRNIAGWHLHVESLAAGLQGIRPDRHPVAVGSIVRVNGQLEVGALSESVTVASEAALLKTDKADVSVDLRPEDVINLPLNQYRNYQTLLNLVPGATPPVFQNAQTDTPGRALSTNINGTNRNNNVTRIDGAASINVWLPHHAGYVAPVETIENVNISTNNFDAAQGMTGGAATAVQTKSGTNNLKGSAFFFRNQDELNARRGYFDPTKLDSSVSIVGGTVGGPIRRNKLFYLRRLGAQRRAQQPLRQSTRADGEDAERGLQRSARDLPRLPDLRPGHGQCRRHGPHRSSTNAVIPANRISNIARKIQALTRRRTTPARTTACRTTCSWRGAPKAIRDNYDGKVNWNRSVRAPDLGQVLDDGRAVQDLFYLPSRRRRRRRHDGLRSGPWARRGR